MGFVLFGIAFGLVAFMTARNAENQGVNATAGKVLGVLAFHEWDHRYDDLV